MGDRSDKNAVRNNKEDKIINGIGLRFATKYVKYKESERTQAITAWT